MIRRNLVTKIEKGVAYPGIRRGGRNTRYEFMKSLKVGDSFKIMPKDVTAVRQYLYLFARRQNPQWEVSVLKVGDHFRAWRMK